MSAYGIAQLCFLINVFGKIQQIRKSTTTCPKCRAHNSIKHVLPALYPNDPSLDYHNLEGIQKGDQAANAFSAMKHMTPGEVEKTRSQLLAYCKLDTFAMVKLWEKLNKTVNNI